MFSIGREPLQSNKVPTMLDVHVIRLDGVIRTSPDGWVCVRFRVFVVQLHQTGHVHTTGRDAGAFCSDVVLHRCNKLGHTKGAHRAHSFEVVYTRFLFVSASCDHDNTHAYE